MKSSEKYPIFLQKMLDQIFDKLYIELQKAVHQNKHPFRFCTLATVENNIPFLRTVVLRDIDEQMNLMMYTDSRTKKIDHLKQHPNASILFYHSKKMIQLILQGTIIIKTEGDEVQKKWELLQNRSRNDYTAYPAPGTHIKNPDDVIYDDEQKNFAILQFIPETIEYLRLKRPNHLRALFINNNSEWKGSFLVP